jgi:pyridinium-3,5-biscarboxylic acid mononucleotide synthase
VDNRATTGTRYITARVAGGVKRPRRRRNPALGSREFVVEGYARLDRDRLGRVGVPEIILGEGKSVPHLIGILRACRANGRGAIVSRLTGAQRRALADEERRGLPLRWVADGRLARLEGPLGGPPAGGVIALVTAGTSDVPLAEEARGLLRELGVETVVAYDVGVAGLHRTLRAVRRLERARPNAYLVFAGREGALPTVVAGLVRAPVVGVPTSVGYGRGGRGDAALNAMLQSCAPIAVVNIDAAVPAALFAAQVLARPVARTPRRLRTGSARANRPNRR